MNKPRKNFRNRVRNFFSPLVGVRQPQVSQQHVLSTTGAFNTSITSNKSYLDVR